MTIKAIGFDLDDTLYDRDTIYRQVFDIMEAEVVRTEVDFEIFNTIYQKYSMSEFALYNEGKISKETYMYQRVIKTYQDIGYNVTLQTAIIFNALYQYVRMHCVRLRPGVVDLLSNLKDQGYELFLLTNGPSQNQWQKIEALELEKYIARDMIFVSGDFGVAKPDLGIFDIVQKKLQCQPTEVVYVGDNYLNDVKAAIEFGWRAVYFDYQCKGANSLNEGNISDFDQAGQEFRDLLV